MAPVVPKINTKFHFTHPNHPLTYLSDDQDYICDGCKTIGSDSRFRCHACDFDLHEFCSNCPEILSSFTHHHDLSFHVLHLGAGALSDRFCDVCLDPVQGLCYRCKVCNFDAHPLCTQLPKELRHVLDSNHSLKLQRLPPFGRCAVCEKGSSSPWVYGCEICRVNVHLDCLLEPYDSPATPPVPPPGLQRSGTTSRGTSFAPPPWPTGPPPVLPYGVAVPYRVPDYPFGFYYHGYPYNYVNYPASQYGYAVPPPPPPPPPGRKLGKSMFSLVGRLTIGAVTASIFGIPLNF